jgi:hypothetical protein
MPAYTAIVRDADARHLFLYSADPLILAPLGPTAPDLPKAPTTPSPWMRDIIDARACLGSAGVRAERYRGVAEAVKGQNLHVLETASRSLQRENDPGPIVERVRALAAAEDDDGNTEVRRLREWLLERYPEHPRVRLLRADDLALAGRWDEVRKILAPCTPASFPDDEDHAQHFSHLLALAALRLGDVEEAERRVAEAALHPGSCDLRGLEALLQPRPDPLATASETEAVPLLTQLVWAVHTADARLHASDPAGALAALDPRRFDVGDEVQVLARRAEASLALSPPGGRTRFAKMMALARFLEAHEGEPDGAREEMPMPGAWARDRLDDLARRAAAWLEEAGQV